MVCIVASSCLLTPTSPSRTAAVPSAFPGRDAVSGPTAGFSGASGSSPNPPPLNPCPPTPPVSMDTPGPARTGAAVAFDQERRQLIVFGGTTREHRDLQDTWAWSDGAWSRVASVGPTPRLYAAAAYDPSKQVVLLYGGEASPASGHRGWEAPLSDTWSWDGTRWTTLGAKDGPALAEPELAYDAERQEMILLGWQVGSNFKRASYRWTGAGWTPTEETGPPLNVGFAFTFDPATKELMVFGGFNQSGGGRDETWLRGQQGWYQAFPAHYPVGTGYRSAAAMGSGSGVELLAACRVWSWDGSDWTDEGFGSGVHFPYLFTDGGRPYAFGLGLGPNPGDSNVGVWPLGQ